MSMLLAGAIMAVTQGQGVFDPSDLFALGEFGAWYDPSDLSTLWQDTAATTPVTASGQLVARMDDKSGNGLHLTQSTAGDRPIYTESGGVRFLDFDGATEKMVSSNFSTTLTQGGGAIAVAANGDNANAINGVLFEQEPASVNDRVGVFHDTRATPKRLAVYEPDGGSTEFVDLDSEIPSTGNVIIFNHDGTTGVGYLDGVLQADTCSTTVSFNADRRIELGWQFAGGLYFDGKFYGGIIIDRELSAGEVSDVNDYLTGKGGF